MFPKVGREGDFSNQRAVSVEVANSFDAIDMGGDPSYGVSVGLRLNDCFVETDDWSMGW